MATKPVTTDVSANAQYLASTLNANFAIIESAIEGCLGRSGTSESPNSMDGILDMDLNKIQNLGSPSSDNDAVRLVDLSDSDATGSASAQLRIEVIPKDSVAELKEAELDPGIYIHTKGFTTPGDGGGAIYLIKTAAAYGGTPDGYGDHYDDAGNVAVLQGDTFNLKQFGVIGDGVTDDTLALIAAADYREGITLKGNESDTYLIDTSAGEITPLDGVTIDFAGATISYTVTGASTSNTQYENAVRILHSNVTIKNLVINIDDSISTPLHGGLRNAITAGEYGNTFGSSTYKNLILENITLLNGCDSNGIALIGDIDGVLVNNVNIIGDDTDGSCNNGILIHWSANNTGSPTTTYHPRNISLKNITFSDVSLSASTEQPSCIFLSAVYNINIENVKGVDVNTGIYTYVGDFGFDYAPTGVPNFMSGISIRNVDFLDVRKYGHRILMRQNGAGGAKNLGMLCSNFQSRPLSGSEDVGLKVDYVVGFPCIFDSNNFSSHSIGYDCQNSSSVEFINGILNLSELNGASFSSVNRCVISNSIITGNNTNTATGDTGAGILIAGTGASNKIFGNAIGAITETQYYGIRINATTVTDTQIDSNEFGNSVSNVAISNESGANWQTLRTHIGSNNDYRGSSITTRVGGATGFMTGSMGEIIVYTTGAPTSGTWKVGDKAMNTAPSASGYIGWVCVTAGTPGTWKAWGSIVA